MTVLSPERGRWLLERGGRYLFEDVDVPRGSSLYGCKLCALSGETVRLPRRKHKQHLAAHLRAVESTKAARPSKGDGTMSSTVTRPEGDLSTQLKRITKRIASTQFQIAHPDKYTKSGKWSDEQKANLEKKLADEKALREEIRAELAPKSTPPAATAAETKEKALDADEHKKVEKPATIKPPQAKPHPKTKAAGPSARKAATRKTTAKKKTAARKTTAAKKTGSMSPRSRAAARKR